MADRIKAGLEAQGIDPAKATVADLKAADEFHTGGLEATEALLDQLDLKPGLDVLDIGSGIGGVSRVLASRFEAQVTGVDLTAEFVDTARDLTAMVGLSEQITYHNASATKIPVADASADLALLIHVGMNIPDKPGVFAEAARVLRPGGTFAVFDVMAGKTDGPLVYPLPWSTAEDTSFVAPPETYRSAAKAAGFAPVAERDRTEFANTFMARAAARVAEDGPGPFGVHLMMGPTAKDKMQNYMANLNAGRIAPTEMIFRAAQ